AGQKPVSGYINNPVTDQGNGVFGFKMIVSSSGAYRGMRLAATATPFEFEGFKTAPPQGTIFGQGFVYGTTSEMSRSIQIVTQGCPADAPHLIAPPPGAQPGALLISWSTAAGATSYNVWTRRPGDVPHLAANTAGSSATIDL